MRYGFILKEKDINDIEILFKIINIKEKEEEKKIIFNKNKEK